MIKLDLLKESGFELNQITLIGLSGTKEKQSKMDIFVRQNCKIKDCSINNAGKVYIKTDFSGSITEYIIDSPNNQKLLEYFEAITD